MARSGNLPHSIFCPCLWGWGSWSPPRSLPAWYATTAIVSNVQKTIDLDNEYGAFQKYLKSQSDFDATLNAVRNDIILMGQTGIYYFLYVVGEQVPPHDEFETEYRK